MEEKNLHYISRALFIIIYILKLRKLFINVWIFPLQAHVILNWTFFHWITFSLSQMLSKSLLDVDLFIYLFFKYPLFFRALLSSQQNWAEGRIPIYLQPTQLSPVSIYHTTAVYLLQLINLHWYIIILQSP